MGSGLNTVINFAQETTYGTGVTPTRSVEITSETLDYSGKQVINGAGLAGGRVFEPGNARYVVGKGGGGALTMNVPSKGFGFWLYNLFGQVTSATHAGTPSAYTHTFTAASTLNKSFTLQKGVQGSTTDPYTFTGCVVNSMQLTMGQNALLTSQITIDSQDMNTATALATTAYPTAPDYFSFANVNNTLTVGGTPYAGIRSFDMTINNQMDLTRMYLGAGGKKAQPVRGNYATATGTLTADYVDQTLVNAFIADTEIALVCTFVAANIATTFNEQIVITLNGLRLNGEVPKVSGPGLVPLSIGFDAFTPVAGGNAVQIDYQTSDVTP